MKWSIDPAHSMAYFSIRHMMAKVRGQMKIKEGWIEAENDHTTAKVFVVLDAASIHTGVEARDNHLRSADGHFDVANFPEITFKSTRVEGKSPERFKVYGDLTIRGITRPVVLEATFGGQGKDAWGNPRVSFSAETTLNRKDFGLTWNAPLEAGGWLLGDEVKIELEVEATPAKDEAEAKPKQEATVAAESR
ncbi:MAG TPA: YceI family protein [Candidatus Limnocylindrales bacterium]|nr:YceI family protein [Candidatus Limnocylindrales bacterium]